MEVFDINVGVGIVWILVLVALGLPEGLPDGLAEVSHGLGHDVDWIVLLLGDAVLVVAEGIRVVGPATTALGPLLGFLASVPGPISGWTVATGSPGFAAMTFSTILT